MTDLASGSKVGARFSILDLAGRGASGEVYRARDLETGALVAVKVIREGSDDEHFQREARVLEGLHHPGIVSYVAHGTTGDGRAYLALEWLEGQTLAARLRSSQPTLAESIGLTAAVGRALAHAHAAGVVHRDIKPSNLFVVGDDAANLKLIDFGIARLTRGTRITRTGLLMGTPAYMAPEQVRGFSDVDARADLFSLGCVLYRCVSGVLPFAAEHMTAILAKVLFEEPRPLRAHRRDVPPELDALVSRLLAKEPEDRPARVESVVAELERIDVVTHRATLPPAAASAPSLGLRERRFVTVVLARGRDDSSDATVVDPARDGESEGGAPRTPNDTADLAEVARLVDGTLAATFAGAQSPVDHAAQAARFALRIARAGGARRAVVATGRGVVEERLPIGEVLERAAKMLDESAADGVVLDAASARLLEGRFDLASAGARHVLVGERRSAAQARTLLGKPTPLVGRERELAIFAGLVDETIAESAPRCALLTAPAGMGKSRLVAEVLERARERHPDLVAWFAGGDPLSEGSALGLVAELVRVASHARMGEPLDAHRALLRATLEEAGATDEECARISGALAPVAAGVDETTALATDARAYSDRLRAAFEDFVRCVGRARPVVMVVEDLQWGDLASARLLDGAMRNLQDTPFFVLGIARPEANARFPNLWDERAPLRVELSDLSRRAARKLVAAVLGEVDDAVADEIVERAAGNAFHLEELVRAVAEGRGRAMPETVLAMVSQRLQALDPESRRLLRAASIFGETFWERGVLALVGDTDDASWSTWSARLGELLRRELIDAVTGSQLAGEVEYRFRHAVVREAAYAMLTDADRAAGHRLAGTWLAAARSTDALTLAEHFERGGAKVEAGANYLRAAQQALLGGDVAGVLDLCSRARRCAPETGAAERARLEAEAHLWRAEFALAERAAEACVAASNPAESAWWSAGATLVVSCLRREARDRMLDVYEAMRAAPFESTVAPVRLFAASRVAVHLCAAGFFPEADLLLETIHADLARLSSPDPATLGAVRSAEGMRALCAGDVAGCYAAMQAAVELFQTAGDLRNASINESNLGFCASELGAYADAERALTAASARAAQLGLLAVELSTQHNLGYVLLRLGRYDEARAVERASADAFEAQGDRRVAGGSRIYLALIALETGDFVEAELQISRALAILSDTPPVRAFALAVQSKIRLARGLAGEARAAAAEASALLGDLGAMEQGESLVRLMEAETLLAIGDREAGLAAAASARERVLERARKLSDERLRRSFLEAVPENVRTLAMTA